MHMKEDKHTASESSILWLGSGHMPDWTWSVSPCSLILAQRKSKLKTNLKQNNVQNDWNWMGTPEELQYGDIMRHSTSCTKGMKDCLTPVCSHCSIPLQLLTQACTTSIGPVWTDGPKRLWNKHKTEHHFCSDCLTAWICPRTHNSSSSWHWGLTCLFSITNALDIVALNKIDLLLTYHIHHNKQHIYRTCPTGNTPQFGRWFVLDSGVLVDSHALCSWIWKVHQHLKYLRYLESTVSERQLPVWKWTFQRLSCFEEAPNAIHTTTFWPQNHSESCLLAHVKRWVIFSRTQGVLGLLSFIWSNYIPLPTFLKEPITKRIFATCSNTN